MTRDITPGIATVKLFLTEPHPCSYLEDREAITAFVDPGMEVTAPLYSRLSAMGYRRSGRYIYAPHCEGCNACIPVRIQAGAFKCNRRQKKCLNRNRDLVVRLTGKPDSREHYALYSRYISARHRDGDMFPPTMQQYEDFVGGLWESTQIMEFRCQGRLLAGSVIDWLDNGLSAIYTYFCPDEARRSLGTFAILSQVELARSRRLPYVYLGYWIKDCRKMAYKKDFRPLEARLNGRWVTLPCPGFFATRIKAPANS